ncbi:MAG: nrdA, partial [Candidatus Paceibacter sp.]|nr:nrdA [Candidatus Paceibacter sp.]
SEWSKGKVPIDSMKTLEAGRGRPLTIAKESKHKGLNWDLLREKVKKGMRNATLMAVAPNANIGLVAGTTPGIDPRFAQIFSRNKISGKYMDINHNLVKDLKNMNIWDKVKEEIIENQGDISGIQAIPQHLKDIYKTSFTTSPYAFIEVAARAQKWVDQALSRNMYLETRDIDETMKIYTAAWDKGLKSTYYLHMKPRHTAEQSTVAVNKAVQIGKLGFGAIKMKKDESNVSPQPFAAPLQQTLEIPADIPLRNEPVQQTLASEPAPAATHESQAPEKNPTKVSEPSNATKASHAGSPVVKTKGFVSFKKLNREIYKAEKGGSPKVCPADPAERAQCDSCQ